MDRPDQSLTPLLGFTAASFVLQLAGFVSPGWKIIKMPTETVRQGLWYVTLCSEMLGTCTTTSAIGDNYDPYSEGGGSSMLEYQIEASLALACSLVSVVFGFIVYKTEKEQRKRDLTNVLAVLLLVSGLLALIASGSMADSIRKVHTVISSYLGHSLFGFPYSIVMTGIGGIMQIVGCIIHLLSKQCGDNSEPRHPAVNRYYPTTASPRTAGGKPTEQQYQPMNEQTEPNHEQEMKLIPGKDPEEAPPPYSDP